MTAAKIAVCEEPSGKTRGVAGSVVTYACNRPLGHETSTVGHDHRFTTTDGAILARWDEPHGATRTPMDAKLEGIAK